VVETLREFPKIEDPRTGRSLMERTIIICNTSAMPVAARESSVYTAITLAEYYRQMGLHVLLLADSTSRWAQAMREISGRLEEIPGDEAYPAYLESRIASFYERAGIVKLYNGETGSVTIGGTVSPAGGTFEEPVTQSTLKVVGAFHGLSGSRANARRFPAIDPHESWSKYKGFIDPEHLSFAHTILSRGRDVEQMMRVVGEEGTSLDDYTAYLKSEFIDQVYLQQNAFDPVDGITTQERQLYVFGFLMDILKTEFTFIEKSDALRFFQFLRQAFINWNYKRWDTDECKKEEAELRQMLEEATREEGKKVKQNEKGL
jgi:V/A-type H+-transporting ATPase subunit A